MDYLCTFMCPESQWWKVKIHIHVTMIMMSYIQKEEKWEENGKLSDVVELN